MKIRAIRTMSLILFAIILLGMIFAIAPASASCRSIQFTIVVTEVAPFEENGHQSFRWNGTVISGDICGEEASGITAIIGWETAVTAKFITEAAVSTPSGVLICWSSIGTSNTQTNTGSETGRATILDSAGAELGYPRMHGKISLVATSGLPLNESVRIGPY